MPWLFDFLLGISVFAAVDLKADEISNEIMRCEPTAKMPGQATIVIIKKQIDVVTQGPGTSPSDAQPVIRPVSKYVYWLEVLRNNESVFSKQSKGPTRIRSSHYLLEEYGDKTVFVFYDKRTQYTIVDFQVDNLINNGQPTHDYQCTVFGGTGRRYSRPPQSGSPKPRGTRDVRAGPRGVTQ